MNTRSMLFARVAALLVIFSAMFFAPSATQAQAIDCSVCDHFTFAVNSGLSCPVTICGSIGATEICRTVAPGQSVSIPCSVDRVWVVTCSGPYTILPSSSSSCTPALKFDAGCCGQICTTPSKDFCSRIEVQPLPCLTPTCP